MTAPTITDAMVEAALAAWHGVSVEMERQLLSPVKAKKMRAALEAAERAAWRPIEEAPKDGTAILLGGGSYHCEARRTDIREAATGCWFEGFWLIAGTEDGIVCVKYHKPTRFRPLPPPPEGDGK